MNQENTNITAFISFEAIKRGDTVEFEALFRKYYPSMCVVATKFVQDPTVAEDLVQEVFVKLWTKRKDYESIPNLKTFLYVAVKNLCFNHLRDKKDTIDYEAAGVANLEDHFRNHLIEEETYRLLAEAVEQLPSQSRRIIQLALVGKQNKEISEILGISVNTVKTLKYNAISMLRQSVKGHFCLFAIILCQ